MSRIKLKELLNFTEQAPQPPPVPGQPAQPPAAAPTPAAGQSPTPEAPAPEGDEPPSPDNPGEYDFTRDFKNFESTIEKSKQQAKKKFLDKMNQMLKDKKVTINASRGYGQPQKDYTIEKVTKASVDWYYNKNVVVLTDENGKEYFLTPGVNVKIEAAAAAEPETPEGQPGTEAPTAPPNPAAGGPPTTGTATQTGPQATGAQTTSPEEPSAQVAKPGMTGTTPPPGGPPPEGVKPEEEPAPEENPQQAALKKKKKITPAPAMAEEATDGGATAMKAEDVKDIGNLIAEFVPDNVKQSMGGRFDVRKYFKHGLSDRGGDGGWSSDYTIEIPAEIFGGNLDEREFKLEAQNQLRSSGGPGQPFSRGRVDVTRHGRYYVFEFHESGGLDI
jgi:hypothetical protein